MNTDIQSPEAHKVEDSSFAGAKDDRIAVVLNQSAKSVNQHVIDTIRRHLAKGDIFTSRHIEEAASIAKTIVQKGYGTVLTGGGDGTFTVMATEVMRAAEEAQVEPPRFGLLKLGTGNALAWVAGASPLAEDFPQRGTDTVPVHAPTKDLYLVDVEERRTPFAGIGADAQILADYNFTKSKLQGTPLQGLGRGLAGYGLAGLFRSLPTFVVNRMPRIRIVNMGADAYPVGPEGPNRARPIKKGELLYEGRARLAAFSTIPYYGFGMRLFPFADCSSGKINLRVMRMGSAQFVANVLGIWNGTYYDPETMADFLVEHFRIECDEPLDFQIGGDSRGTRKTVEARVTKYPLKLVDFNA